MTDTELDFLIADKVMGWAPHKRNTVHWTLKEKSNEIEYPIFSHTDVWSPSHKIEDAWMVVEKIRERWAIEIKAPPAMGHPYATEWIIYLPTGIDCAMRDNGRDDSLPKAICLATLKAVGVEI